MFSYVLCFLSCYIVLDVSKVLLNYLLTFGFMCLTMTCNQYRRTTMEIREITFCFFMLSLVLIGKPWYKLCELFYMYVLVCIYVISHCFIMSHC